MFVLLKWVTSVQRVVLVPSDSEMFKTVHKTSFLTYIIKEMRLVHGCYISERTAHYLYKILSADVA